MKEKTTYWCKLPIKIYALITMLALLFPLVTFSQTYTFTNAGASGRFGPTQAQCNTAYGAGIVTVNTQGIQEWIVPVTGNYSIQAIGASGGQQGSYEFGTGANIYSEFALTAGTVLKIAVGQFGLNGTNWEGSGGGGGSFVVLFTGNSPLLVAAGGSGSDGNGGDTSRTHPGGSSIFGNPAIQGTTTPNGSEASSAGGGFNLDGENGYVSIGGQSFLNGALGGICNYGQALSHGGFGGGGAGDWYTSGGGGGGYQGGNTISSYGGGTGPQAAYSYNSGSNQINISGIDGVTNAALKQNGQVIITRLCTPSTLTPDTASLPDATISCTTSPTTPTATNNCGLIVNGTSNVTFPITTLGTTVVTWTYTDGTNTITQTQNILVADVTPPTITCAANVTTNTTTGCLALVPNVAPIVSDDCSSFTNVLGLTQNSSNINGGSVDCGLNGQIAKSYRVYDLFAMGINSNITINTIKARTNAATTLQVSLYSYTGTIGTTLDMTQATLIVSSAPIAGGIGTLLTFPMPANTIVGASKFIIEIANVNTAVQNGVSHNTSGTETSPTYFSKAGCVGNPGTLASLIPATGANYKVICEVTATTATADPLVTFTGVPLGYLYPIGTTNTTYTATDASGNSASCVRQITVQDTVLPTVITQNITVQLDATGNATITAAQIDNGSTDNCSIATMTVSPNTFTCANIGANIVTLTVTDVNGNISTGTATVTIQDTVLPTVITQNITVQLDATGNATITAAQIDNGSTDNCSIATMTVSPNTFTCANVGANIVTLTVTDANGNISTGTATVTIQDTVLPTVITQNITVQLDATGNATITAAQIDNGSTDNCSIATMTVSPNTFTCANVGANIVTLTVTDVNGNISTGTATVTIQDTVLPTVITQNITVQLDVNGDATITAAQIDNGSTDNCGITTITVSPNTFTCADAGPNTVTLTVTDVNGNVNTATAIITVANSFGDNDSDGIKDNCDDDDDNDGVLDTSDNCELTANSDQADNDADGMGDLCDDDDDNDGLLDTLDNCQFIDNPNQEDRDHDGIGDACDLIEVNVSEAITPNGDGINDTWMIYNIENHPNNSVRVFNRWGSEVFFAKSYQNDWNGAYKNNSQPLPDAGSYYYQLDLDGNGSIEKDGWIYITRQ